MKDTIPLRRRTVVGAAAWATPVIVASVSTPAIASSQEPAGVLSLIAATGALSVARCATTTDASIAFQVLRDGVPSPTTKLATVTLPTGLRFAGPDPDRRTVILTADATGRFAVPRVQATGVAGTYTVSATVDGVTAHARVNVTAGPGYATLLAFGNKANFATVFNKAEIAQAYATSDGHIMLDSNGSLWGTGASWGVASNGAPNQYFPKMKIGSQTTSVQLRMISVSNLGRTTIQNILAVDTQNRVGFIQFELGLAGQDTLIELLSGGKSLNGNVMEIHSYSSGNIVRTSTGVYAHGVGLADGSTVSGDLRSVLSGSFTAFGTWGDRTNRPRPSGRDYMGFMLAVGTTIWEYSGYKGWDKTEAAQARVIASLPSGQQAKEFGGGPDGIRYALSTTGTLYAMNPKRGLSTWWHLLDNVETISTWSKLMSTGTTSGSPIEPSHTGGLALHHDGKVTQFQISTRADASWMPSTISGLPRNIVKVYGEDGSYAALTSEGSLYTWENNLDIGPTPPKRSTAVVGATDLALTANNSGGSQGYAVAITNPSCTLI